jgi:hypothetical protein
MLMHLAWPVGPWQASWVCGGHAQTWPCLSQKRAQHWTLVVHLRARGLHFSAEAALGVKPSAEPMRAPPNIHRALRRERVPLASRLVRASKERSCVVQSVHSPSVTTSPLRSSAAIGAPSPLTTGWAFPQIQNRPPISVAGCATGSIRPRRPIEGRDSQPLPNRGVL